MAAAVPSTDPGWAYPTFSLEERDRRWSRVRELMADQGVSCIVASACTGIQGRAHADVKYLTQLGQNDEQFGVLFPAAGAPLVLGWPGRRPGDAWIDERRPLDGGFLSPATWGRTMASLVLELGLEQARIAVCGLAPGGAHHYTQIRQTEGYVPFTTMRALQDALPRAEFVDAGTILGPARYVKSDEEIEFIRIGTGIAERALHAMASTARSRAFEPRVYAAMLAAQVSAGGSLPTMISWSAGPIGQANGRLEQPVHRQLRSGDLISVEVEGRWGGYNGQVDATMTVGDVPSWALSSHEVASASIQATLAAIVPGATFGELRRVAREVAPSDDYEIRLIMHGRGLGDDGPLVGADGPMDAMELVENTTFSVKPAVMHRGRFCARIGESVVVRATGAQRLGTRPLDQYWHVD
jgi:Xaa-Pro aminopeptidase